MGLNGTGLDEMGWGAVGLDGAECGGAGRVRASGARQRLSKFQLDRTFLTDEVSRISSKKIVITPEPNLYLKS